MALYLGSTKIAGGGGAGNANVVSCASYEEYEQIPHDPDTMYVTPDEDGQYAVLDEDNEFTGFNKFAAVGAAQDWDDGQPAPDGTVILTDENGQSYNVRLSRLAGAAGGGDMIDTQSNRNFYAIHQPLGAISANLSSMGITSLYESESNKAVKFTFPKNMRVELAGLSAGISLDGQVVAGARQFTAEPYSFGVQAGDSFYVRTTDNATLAQIVNDAAAFNMGFYPVLPYIETPYDTVKTVYNVTLDKLLDLDTVLVDDITVGDLFNPAELSGATYTSNNYSWPGWSESSRWPTGTRKFTPLTYGTEITSMSGSFCGLHLILKPKVKMRMTCSGMTYGVASKKVQMKVTNIKISADDGKFAFSNTQLQPATYTPSSGYRYFTAKPDFKTTEPNSDKQQDSYDIPLTDGRTGRIWWSPFETTYQWRLKACYKSDGKDIMAWPQNVNQANIVQPGSDFGMYFRSFRNSFAEWKDDATKAVRTITCGYKVLPAGVSKYKHYDGSSRLKTAFWRDVNLTPYIPAEATIPFWAVGHYFSSSDAPTAKTPPPIRGKVYWPRQGGVLTNIHDSMDNWNDAVKFTIMFDKNDVIEARAQAQG